MGSQTFPAAHSRAHEADGRLACAADRERHVERIMERSLGAQFRAQLRTHRGSDGRHACVASREEILERIMVIPQRAFPSAVVCFFMRLFGVKSLLLHHNRTPP